MKKRYAVADEVPEDCGYLMAGIEYEILESDGDLATIHDGTADGCLIAPKRCAHLYGKSWRIVEREE